MTRQAVITPEGLEKLKEEIEFLSTAKRREVAERIKEAREFGDISENAEYDDAKNEQALLEGRIAQLEERLRRATVIDEKDVDTDEVSFGSVVHVKDQKSGDSQKFQIVGSTEADPAEHVVTAVTYRDGSVTEVSLLGRFDARRTWLDWDPTPLAPR